MDLCSLKIRDKPHAPTHTHIGKKKSNNNNDNNNNNNNNKNKIITTAGQNIWSGACIC